MISLVSTSPEIHQIDQVDEKDNKYQQDNKDKEIKITVGAGVSHRKAIFGLGLKYIHHSLHLLQDKIFKTRSLGGPLGPNF